MAYDDAGRTAPPETSSGVPAAVLEHVFDDPAHGEPGRDRIAVHVLWEFVLLAALVAVTWLLWRENADALRGGSLKTLLVDVAALGLLTLAAGLSLRAGAVNLAVGPVALETEGELAPGTLEVRKNAVLVGTGTTPVRLGEVKAFGKKQMQAADWARGTRVQSGALLGAE